MAKCMNSGCGIYNCGCTDQKDCYTTVPTQSIPTAELEELRGVYDATMSNNKYELVDSFAFAVMENNLTKLQADLTRARELLGRINGCLDRGYEIASTGGFKKEIQTYLQGGE